MTPDEPVQRVSIEFHFNQSFRHRVAEEGTLGDWVAVSIVAGDIAVLGEHNPVKGLPASTILDFLDTLQNLADGERTIITFDYGPDWLSVDPVADDIVELARCHTIRAARDPEERRDIDVARQVTNRAWEDAVLAAADQFYADVLELNPETTELDVMVELRTRREEVAEIVEERNQGG